jgi:hypothetical protein
MAHIEFLVEETSAEAALRTLLPKILQAHATFEIHPHNGKSDLLQKLPGKLKSYKHWIPDDWKIVVLIDEDRRDCADIKSELEKYAADAGFTTKSVDNSNFKVLNRIAIEELEAWFFGDIPAIVSAYPGVPVTLGEKAGYRDPDAIQGGTWEKLEKVLQKAGYFPAGMPKVEVATKVSCHMIPSANRSKSFQQFISGIQAMNF